MSALTTGAVRIFLSGLIVSSREMLIRSIAGIHCPLDSNFDHCPSHNGLQQIHPDRGRHHQLFGFSSRRLDWICS